jgi:hypothetical protein
MPAFQPSKYSLKFPFFEEIESDNHTDIVGGEEVIKKINSITYNRLNKAKYWPVIIRTSRGMGKKFLTKFRMQEIKTAIIGNAITTGRIISFDFSKDSDAIQNDRDVYTFFPRLMVYFLCRIFDGTQVDGMNFEEIKSFDDVPNATGRQPKFHQW